MTKQDDAEYAEALKDWERRFDLARCPLEQLALMGELMDRLRPDHWKRVKKNKYLDMTE